MMMMMILFAVLHKVTRPRAWGAVLCPTALWPVANESVPKITTNAAQ